MKKSPPKLGAGQLVITVRGGVSGGIDLVCNERVSRGKKIGSTFAFEDVEKRKCKMRFKPSGATWYGVVHAGKMTCTLSGGGAVSSCQ